MLKNTKTIILSFMLFLFAFSGVLYGAQPVGAEPEACADGTVVNVQGGAGSQDELEEKCAPHGGPAGSSNSVAQPTYNFQGDCKEAELSTENCGIISYIVLIINALSALVGVVVVIMVAVGGIKYSTARDNPQATQLAKQRIANALLALVAYFMLYGVLNYLIPGGLF